MVMLKLPGHRWVIQEDDVLKFNNSKLHMTLNM